MDLLQSARKWIREAKAQCACGRRRAFHDARSPSSTKIKVRLPKFFQRESDPEFDNALQKQRSELVEQYVLCLSTCLQQCVRATRHLSL